MVTVEDVVRYVLTTPENTNVAILRQLLSELVDDGIKPVIIVPTITEDCAEDAEVFATSVYNKKGSNKTLNRENDEDVANNYYVKVVDELPENVLVKIDGKAVGADDKVKLSIGNNSFIDDVYYYVEEGSLYIAFPLLLFEEIEVNGVLVNDATGYTPMNVLDCKVVGQGDIEKDGNGYIANIEKMNSYLDFALTGMVTNEIIISKKIRDGALSYGFIKVDEQVNGLPAIGYYPFAWASNQEAWDNQADITVTEYELFSPDRQAIAQLRVESRKGDAIEDVIIYDGGGVTG